MGGTRQRRPRLSNHRRLTRAHCQRDEHSRSGETQQQRKNRQDMTGRITGWKTILNTLTVHYGDRIAAASIN